jgi:hypothetical protein
VVALLLLAAGCGGSEEEASKTITVEGQPVAVAPLVDAHAGLCEAAKTPAQARALFFDRSHDALHTVARALDDVDRALAGQLLQAKETVESELGASRPGRPEDLLRLADVYRAALGRLAITVAPCD